MLPGVLRRRVPAGKCPRNLSATGSSAKRCSSSCTLRYSKSTVLFQRSRLCLLCPVPFGPWRRCQPLSSLDYCNNSICSGHTARGGTRHRLGEWGSGRSHDSSVAVFRKLQRHRWICSRYCLSKSGQLGYPCGCRHPSDCHSAGNQRCDGLATTSTIASTFRAVHCHTIHPSPAILCHHIGSQPSTSSLCHPSHQQSTTTTLCSCEHSSPGCSLSQPPTTSPCNSQSSTITSCHI